MSRSSTHAKPASRARTTVGSFRSDPLFPRIERAVHAILLRGNVVTPIDVLIEMSILTAAQVVQWRNGGVPYLERAMLGNLTRFARLLRILRMHAHDLDLVPSETAYRQNGSARVLRFTRTGDPALERAYATHLVWSGKGPPPPRKERIEAGALAMLARRGTAQRVVLRPWRDSDIEPFAAMCADPRVMEYFPETLSRGAVESLVRHTRRDLATRGYGWWALQIPGVTDFAGFVGLSVPRFALPFTPCVEIAWRIAHEYWGHGYATEAANRALDIGFNELGLGEIVSYTVPHNARSRRVMEKLGMRTDPAEDFDHPKLPEGHALRRHVLYRLRRADWEARGR